MRPLRAVRLEGPQRDEHDFDALYAVHAPFALDFNSDFDVSYVLGRPDFGELYSDSGFWFGTYGGFPARQLAASTRWRRGKLFGGSLRPLAGQRLAELGDGGGDDYRVEDSGDAYRAI